MEPYEALWSPMEPYEALWSPMEPYEALWSPMKPYEPYEALGCPMNPYGILLLDVSAQPLHAQISPRCDEFRELSGCRRICIQIGIQIHLDILTRLGN